MKTLSSLRQAGFFVIITFSLSWALEYLIVARGGSRNMTLSLLLMWSPGVVGILCSLLFKRRFVDLGFRMPDWKSLGIAYLVPVTAAIVVFLLLIILKIDHFEIHRKGGVAQALFRLLFLAPVVYIWLTVFAALGEEIGWRGFLFARLKESSIPGRGVMTGLIWSIWHWPLILFSDYATSAHPMVSLALFTVATTSWGIFIDWLRDRSHSIWPCAIAHASHNMWIIGVYPAFLRAGPDDQYWGGESGILIALLYVALACLVARKTFATPVLAVS